METGLASDLKVVKSTIIIDLSDDQDDLNIFNQSSVTSDAICSSAPPIKVCLDSEIPDSSDKLSSPKSNLCPERKFFVDKGNLSEEILCPYDQCKKVFKDVLQFRSHYRSHQEKRHECQYCHHKFMYLKDKKIHERIHTGERPYQCQQCKKSFAQKITLSNHLLTHSKSEKGEVCDICGRAYYHKKSLAHHKKEKHPEQMAAFFFTCAKCGKKYLGLTRYNLHIAKCKGKKTFSCQACDLVFKREKQLEEHKMECTQSCLFQCGICDVVMNSEKSLRSHLFDVHMTGLEECVKIRMIKEQDV